MRDGHHAGAVADAERFALHLAGQHPGLDDLVGLLDTEARGFGVLQRGPVQRGPVAIGRGFNAAIGEGYGEVR